VRGEIRAVTQAKNADDFGAREQRLHEFGDSKKPTAPLAPRDAEKVCPLL